jgi:type IV secretion system protein VirD4
MKPGLKIILIWAGLSFCSIFLSESLMLCLVVVGLISAYRQDPTLLKPILRSKKTRAVMLLLMLLCVLNGFLEAAPLRFYDSSSFAFFFFHALVSTVLITLLWPLACYVYRKLPTTVSRPTTARPDILTSPEIQSAVITRCPLTDAGVYAGNLRDLSLYISSEDRAVVIGPPGTGKTAFLITQLLEWVARGHSLVVNDIKPEIYGIVRHRLEAAGYQVITYNPTAGTGFRYNPFDDVGLSESRGELLATLVPSLHDDDKIFSETARDLLDGITSHLRVERGTVSLPLIWDFLGLNDDYDGLIATLTESPSPEARHVGKSISLLASNPRFLGSVMANLNAHLRYLRYPHIRASLEQSDFSLFDLCRPQGKVALFLQFEEIHQDTTSLLFSAFLSHVLRFFIEHTARPPVLLLLDEIGNVPPVKGLVKKLNTIRSRQLPTWLYFQSQEQMQRYGSKTDEGAGLILGACDFQMVFRLNDNDTAAWMSEKIGTLDRLSTSVTMPGWIMKNLTQSLTREPLIFPHELQQLSPGESIASYRGVAWRNQALPYYQRWPEFRDIKVTPHGSRQPSWTTMAMTTTTPSSPPPTVSAEPALSE